MNFYSRYFRYIKNGDTGEPRGLKVKQRRNQRFSFFPGQVVRRPRDNILIGFMEMLQFIGGVFDIDAIAAVAPNAHLQLFTSQSAYGPRVALQVLKVIHELNMDKDTRRAVLAFSNPLDDLGSSPCTTSMQFQIMVNNAAFPELRILQTTVTMRSSDVVWGMPYDMVQFGGMAMAIAEATRSQAGIIIVNMGNAHVYNETVEVDRWEVFDPGFVFPAKRDFEKSAQFAREIVSLHLNKKQFVTELCTRNVISHPRIVERLPNAHR